MSSIVPNKLYFIYVAKNQEWQQRQKQDWAYVYSMTRFYHWWVKHFFNIDFIVDADILPVIPGRLFDRMSVGYLARDHNQRGKSTYHFYLAYFKPLWTDCDTEGYSSENFGMIHWRRPDNLLINEQRIKFFADTNCPKVSHILCHEILRIKGKRRNEYFEMVHDLWDSHVYKGLPYIYYNGQFKRVTKDSIYHFVTVDISKLRSRLKENY